MKNMMKWAAIVLGVLFGLALLAGLALYPIGMEKLTRLYPDIPVEAAKIPGDPDAVARGRHVATIWACTTCHGANMNGMVLVDDPIEGTIVASNLTSGKGGVAGSYTNTDWVRAIRHGVKPNARAEVLMYDYSTMSEQDLGDLIAYMKQLSPVDSDHPATRVGPIAAIAPVVGLSTVTAETIDHRAPRPADPAPGATKEYGRYLAAICVACHGSYAARKLDGWKQDDFIRAFRTGVAPNGKRLGPTMSSKTFSEMTDMELSALWLYLRGVPPLTLQK
ncbi:MAG: c-type cytochrome [Chloroflexi bacterium]|nr:c-type cytochrome [Chloroflexota bacterium]